MDPQAEIRARLRERELNGKGRERQPRRDRASGGVKSEKNEEAAKQFEEERKAWRERNAAKLASGEGGSRSGDADDEDRQIAKGLDLQQKNRESLANSIRMAKEATEVGQDTVMKLTAQKEQMKKMDEDLDKTNESLNRSERVIRGMKSTLGGIRNFFTKPTAHVSQRLDVKSIKVDGGADSKEETEPDADAAHHHHEAGEDEDGETEGDPRKLPLRDRDLSRESDKTRQALQTFQENQHTEDEQLDELGDLLGQLKGQAKDMNKELKVQEKLVDHLDNQIVKTGSRVKAADQGVKQID